MQLRTASLRHNTETTRDVVVAFFVVMFSTFRGGGNKHSQLTLSTCIVSDSITRLEPEIIPSFSCMPVILGFFFGKSGTIPDVLQGFFFLSLSK